MSEDPYVPDACLPEGRWIRGKYAGRKIDVSARRPLRVLRGAAAASFAPGEGDIVAANFYHDGRFWIAKFPKDPVEEVLFLKWDFGTKRLRLKLGKRLLVDRDIFHVAHTEIRFKLKQGRAVILYPQRMCAGPARPHEEAIPDFVASVEAVGVPGESFNLFGGMANHFVAVRRFKSLRENYYERVVEQGRVIEQWVLDLKEDKKQMMLRRAIRFSHVQGLGRLYNGWSNSCTTEAFSLIDSVMRYGIRHWRTVFKRIPLFPEAYLWARRLLKSGGESRVPALNDEKAAWKGDARCRRRLKACLDETRAERRAARKSRRARRGNSK